MDAEPKRRFLMGELKIGATIARLRKLRGLTQSDLAEELFTCKKRFAPVPDVPCGIILRPDERYDLLQGGLGHDFVRTFRRAMIAMPTMGIAIKSGFHDHEQRLFHSISS